MEELVNPDFHYLCDNCQKLVPAYLSNPLAGIESVPGKRPNEYVFHCDDCVNLSNSE